MWIELSNTQIILLNVLGIPAAHILLSYLCTAMPSTWFEKKHAISSGKPHPIYQKLFLIRKWKHLLPDAAPWMNGFPKGKLQSTEPDYLKQFILETRRGELSHWLQLLIISTFIIWNPFPANLIIITYAILSNLPCILNLRHTRHRLTHHLSLRTS